MQMKKNVKYGGKKASNVSTVKKMNIAWYKDIQYIFK